MDQAVRERSRSVLSRRAAAGVGVH
jgi:hypothetical protein